jgi:hypothetical protein
LIPLDPAHWEVKAKAHVYENYKGKDAIYIQQGRAISKDIEFLNGTIEFDVFLTDRPSFPGIYFRAYNEDNMESFYLRPHQSGNPDSNQAAPKINGITAWQLYYGEMYSFPYSYKLDDWTHVKLIVNDVKAQVYLDYSAKPNLSWTLKHPPRKGKVSIGSSSAPTHFANFKITENEGSIVDFVVKTNKKIDGIITKWKVSDIFEEKLLNNTENLSASINQRIWKKEISIEENNAANISWASGINGPKGNTVFTKVTINSTKSQLKLFEFGYSDRVLVILNGKPIYRGNNSYRSRDYRYLGTMGFFDSVYLDLKKGENTLLLAVSEDFGGWGVTGRFVDKDGINY